MDAKPSNKQKLVKDNTTPSKATSVENDKKSARAIAQQSTDPLVGEYDWDASFTSELVSCI